MLRQIDTIFLTQLRKVYQIDTTILIIKIFNE